MDDIPIPHLYSAQFQDFVSRIFEDILAGRVTSESVFLVLAFFGFFFLLTALSYVFARKPKEKMLEHPVTWVTDYNRMAQLLDAAVTQRSKVRVSFHRDMGGARSTDAVLLEAGRDGLTLELSSLKNASQSWVGRTLDLSFRLRLPEQPQVQSIFSFVSDIISLSRQAGDVVVMRISRPLRLELNQNRQFLRVEPPEKYVRAFKLWTEDAVRRQGDPEDPETWGEPLYAWEFGGVREVVLENISGGGLLAEVTPEALRAKPGKITVGQHYYCSLTVAAPDFTFFSTHYLALRVVKCHDDCDSKVKLSLGLAFTGSGTPQEAPLTGLRWRAANRDYGVREIDDWAYELHLELYRNKGIA